MWSRLRKLSLVIVLPAVDDRQPPLLCGEAARITDGKQSVVLLKGTNKRHTNKNDTLHCCQTAVSLHIPSIVQRPYTYSQAQLPQNIVYTQKVTYSVGVPSFRWQKFRGPTICFPVGATRCFSTRGASCPSSTAGDTLTRDKNLTQTHINRPALSL